MLLPDPEFAGAVESKLVIVVDVEVTGVGISEEGGVEFVPSNTVDKLISVDDVVVLDIVEDALAGPSVTLDELIAVLKELDGDDVEEDVLNSDWVELADVLLLDVELIDEELEEVVATSVVEV